MYGGGVLSGMVAKICLLQMHLYELTAGGRMNWQEDK